jgi:hypothetical protein
VATRMGASRPHVATRAKLLSRYLVMEQVMARCAEIIALCARLAPRS